MQSGWDVNTSLLDSWSQSRRKNSAGLVGEWVAVRCGRWESEKYLGLLVWWGEGPTLVKESVISQMITVWDLRLDLGTGKGP